MPIISISISKLLYFLLLILVIIQRLFEIRLSHRNKKKLLLQGGKEFYPQHFPFMVMVHSFWFVSCFIEAYYQKSPPPLIFSLVFFMIFLLGQTLRYQAIKTLGERWNVKIIVLPHAPPIRQGLFKFIRHPNYLGVSIEIFSLPLIYGLWKTAFIFTVFNSIILFIRIKAEEKALNEYHHYDEIFNS